MNETHRVLARTLDSARKTLGGRAAGAGLKAPPFPEDVGPRIPHDLRALARFITSSYQGMRVMSKIHPDRATLRDVVSVVVSVLD